MLLLICIAHLFACISPGPDILLTIHTSITRGKLAAFVLVLGILTGVTVQFTVTWASLHNKYFDSTPILIGLSALGGTYLIFLAYSIFKAPPETNFDSSSKTKEGYFKNNYLTGFFVNILNPKAWFYFISLFPLIATPNTAFDELTLPLFAILAVQLSAYSVVLFAINTKTVRRVLESKITSINQISSVLLGLLGLILWGDLIRLLLP